MIELSPTQDLVLCEVAAWVRSAKTTALRAPFKYLAGYAGTGKSTIVNKLAEEFSVAYCAFTGKAANVLREKGCATATTLHKLIYRPQEKAVRMADGQDTWSTEFIARDDNPLKGFDLVVLDECSMVDARMAQDILSYGVPVLVTGDPFQLPPVSGEGYFTSREPDWLLTDVYRQALDSGILRLATDIRSGRGILDPMSYAPDAAVITLEEAVEQEDELLRWRSIIITGTHRMREHFNKRFRELNRFTSAYPEEGDELVCLANDHKRGLLNGGTWLCEAPARDAGHLKLEMLVRSADDPKQRLLAECWAHDFVDLGDELQKLPWQKRSARARFTYGYALTCHKAQGSAWENVLVIDESSTFREHAMNWLYTAATRASQRLVLVRR